MTTQIDEEKLVDMMNIFMIWIKDKHNLPPTTSLFDNIDYDKIDSTNTYLELLYDNIKRFNEEINHENKMVKDQNKFNKDDHEEFYQLIYIENSKEIVLECPYIMPLLNEIIETKTHDWDLIKIK